jgi:hypothetical protein
METATEISLMKQRLTNMEEKLSEVEGKVDGIDKKLDEVYKALVGNKIANSKGLVGDIEYVLDKVDEHDAIIKKTRWTVISFAAIGTIVVFLIKAAWEYFINKK